MSRHTPPGLLGLLTLLALLPLATACKGSGSDLDGGADGGVECTTDDACSIDDGDPCTVARCVENTCVLERRPPAMTRIASLTTTDPALAVDYSGSRLLVAEGPAGVGEYRVSTDDAGNTTISEQRHYPTTGEARRVRGLSGHVLVAEGLSGIEVFPNGDTSAQSLYQTPDRVMGLAMVDSVVIAFVYGKGLHFVDYSAWDAPVAIRTVDTRGRAYDAVRWGDHILIADGLAGVADLDNSDPENPAVAGEPLVRTEGRVVALRRRHDLLALAESGAGAGLVDLGADGGPTRIAHLDLGGPVVDTNLLSTHTVLFAASDGGLTILDLLDPEAPSVWIREVPEGPVLDIDRDGERIALALGPAGVALYDLRCTPPESP